MDPLPGQVEYSVHTQSHTDTHSQAHTYAHSYQVAQFLCCSTVSRQAGASEGDIRVFCITQRCKAHQKAMPLILNGLHLRNHWDTLTRKVICAFSPAAFKWQERNTTRESNTKTSINWAIRSALIRPFIFIFVSICSIPALEEHTSMCASVLVYLLPTLL